jgi:Protein of unknown function (DUF2690)
MLKNVSRRLLTVVALAFVLGAGIVIVHPQAAHAASPSCYGDPNSSANSCNGKNPASTNCASSAYSMETQTATSFYNTNLSVARVELRYSPYCNAFWTRVTILSTYLGTSDITGKNAYMSRLTGYINNQSVQYTAGPSSIANGQSFYTRMADPVDGYIYWGAYWTDNEGTQWGGYYQL